MPSQITLTHDHKKKLLKLSEISLSLDTYDDIFSDFDPRPYSERALSDDFLIEAKKASKDQESGLELNLLIPTKNRKMYEENIIKKRLWEHFRKHYHALYNEKKKLVLQGMSFVLVGVVLMFIAGGILFKHGQDNALFSLLIVLLEPAGWFLFWEGMHMMIFDSKAKNPDFEFYRKMSTCNIKFLPY